MGLHMRFCLSAQMRIHNVLCCCRPLDCASNQPSTYVPGFVNITVFSDKVETGWGVLTYPGPNNKDIVPVNQELQAPQMGLDGGNASCFTFTQGPQYQVRLALTQLNNSYVPQCPSSNTLAA